MELQSITTIAFATELDYLSIISAVNQESVQHHGEKHALTVSASEHPDKQQVHVTLLMDATISEMEDVTEAFISGVMSTLDKRHDITRATQLDTTITPT